MASRAHTAQAAPVLAAHGHRVDVPHLDAVSLVLLLERFLDVGLVGRLGDPERVTALRVELVGALGDDRADHDLGGGAGGHSASWSPWSWSSWPTLGRCGRLKLSLSSSRQSF